MSLLKCEYCGNEKYIKNILRNYVYKKQGKNGSKTYYYCSYKCMREAEKEYGEKFVKRKIF